MDGTATQVYRFCLAPGVTGVTGVIGIINHTMSIGSTVQCCTVMERGLFLGFVGVPVLVLMLGLSSLIHGASV